jgi:hypothetical protein
MEQEWGGGGKYINFSRRDWREEATCI